MYRQKSKKYKSVNNRGLHPSTRRVSRINLFISVSAALIVVVVGYAIVVTLAVDVPGEWQVHCAVNHTNKDDPIVWPGLQDKSHMHSFYGNTTTNYATTTESLMASRSDCAGNLGSLDRSAYWIPALFEKQSDGTLKQLPQSGQIAFIYYSRPGGSTGPKVLPFPNGLRMITGTATATTPQPQSIVRWSCGGGGGGPQHSHIPVCSTAGQPLHAAIFFPSCWNGRDLDSADHKSHMAFASSNGTCPSTHPVSLPTLHLDLDFEGVTGGPNLVLASGGQYSLHADFWAAWDVRTQNMLTIECVNGNRSCTGLYYDSSRQTIAIDPWGQGGPVFNLNNYSSTPMTSAPATPPPAPTDIQGDLNGDSLVNIQDLSVMLANWGKTTGQLTNSKVDMNGDGIITILDLSMLLVRWGALSDHNSMNHS